MKGFLLFIVALLGISLSFSSCVTKEKCNKKFPPVEFKKDSTSSKEVITYKDTTVYDTVKGDTVYIGFSVECDTKTGQLIDVRKKKIFENEFLIVYLTVKNGVSKATIIRKTLYRDYLFQKIYSEKLREHFQSSTKVITVTEDKTPVWNWLLFGFLIAVIVYLFIKR